MSLDPRFAALGQATRTAGAVGGLSARVRSIEAHGSAPGKDWWVVGDGTRTEFTLHHGRGTRRVMVEVVTNDDEGATLYAPAVTVARPSEHSVRVTFAVAPAPDSALVLLA